MGRLLLVTLAVLARADAADDGAGITITEKEGGTTVVATVAQEVRITLKGDRKQTGWEPSHVEGDALAPIKVGGSFGGAPTPITEFTAAEAGSKEIGDYTFRYRAAKVGTSKLRFVFMYPYGGEGRDRSVAIREMTVTVQVVAAK